MISARQLAQAVLSRLRGPPPAPQGGRRRGDSRRARLAAFHEGGRVPWTPGYAEYREDFVKEILNDESRLAAFRDDAGLPPGYGVGLDERAVEYPWLMTRLREGAAHTLDAGSTLNHGFLLDHPRLLERRLVICTLAPEGTLVSRAQVSYVFGDLRDTILRDDTFDEIVSISTLDHVGLDNTKLFTRDGRYREASPRDYRQAVAEFHRMLKPGGRAWITVPYGAATVLSWQQQFDAAGVADMVATFGGALREETYFRYDPSGWQRVDAAACRSCAYHDFTTQPPAADGAAAARAVVCLALEKT